MMMTMMTMMIVLDPAAAVACRNPSTSVENTGMCMT